MDAQRFDRLSRRMAGSASRRAAFAAALAVLAGVPAGDSDAKRKKGCTAKKANCESLAPGACLRGCDFEGRSLMKISLAGADLRDANLHNASLFESSLNAANLSNANLSQANLWYADLTNALIGGADFTDASFCYTKWIDGQYRYDDCSAP